MMQPFGNEYARELSNRMGGLPDRVNGSLALSLHACVGHLVTGGSYRQKANTLSRLAALMFAIERDLGALR